MDRTEQLLKYIRKEQRGIEVGPYFRPLVPKRRGYDSLTMDVFDTARLIENARNDPLIAEEAIAEIEEVDIVGSCAALATLVGEKYSLGSFDYIVSSHNFEHLPDPIRFLRDCEAVLKRGGIVSMAVPDRRATFDYFRPVTTLADWLDAYAEARILPSPAQVFEGHSLRGAFNRNGQTAPGFLLGMEDPNLVIPAEDLEAAYQTWQEDRERGNRRPYRDAHCSVFTPSSLRLMIEDLRFLGLIRLELVELIVPPNSFEFYVHLRNAGPPAPAIDRAAFYERRAATLREMVEEAAEATATFVHSELSLRRASGVDPRILRSRTAAFRHLVNLMWRKGKRRGRV